MKAGFPFLTTLNNVIFAFQAVTTFINLFKVSKFSKILSINLLKNIFQIIHNPRLVKYLLLKMT
jgi:hypothetical protein